ncbi:MAG: hemerythrin family protein [Desulfobacteraceae bacterium]|nr:hemerythrin family protein [Desulfobacteraceae bacterium]
MPIVKWMKSLSVNDEKIDDQHKKWIELYNRVHAQMMGIEPTEDYLGIGEAALAEMIEYTKYHFSSEEDFMKKIGFPEYEKHRKIHEAFIRKLEAISYQMQEDTHVLNSEVLKVIEDWFINHILKEDQEITKYARRLQKSNTTTRYP